MQGLQVPTWLGVLLVLAVPVGTVFGAWWGHRAAARTAAKRDDARWERERDREELRWQREREHLTEQRQHELRLDWRDRKLGSYSDFLAHFEKAQLTLIKLLGRRDLDAEFERNLRRQLDESLEACGTAIKVLRVIAEHHIQNECSELVSDAINLLCEKDYVPRATLEVVNELLTALAKRRWRLLDAMRISLGVNDPDTPPIFNPAPPSETTS
ncbi:hypothetical protein [Amycolatopsis sp. BJA-103]|uniref:hypothetical protein n=1 Tax=Amycolatopsis sp. BJA-103 TaxID=1911175 RepID=UPI0011AEDC0F|nr:hypothetical protein [Amycolatopsis sp. BJA-103]